MASVGNPPTRQLKEPVSLLASVGYRELCVAFNFGSPRGLHVLVFTASPPGFAEFEAALANRLLLPCSLEHLAGD